jgi:hypothetical protein
VYFLSYFKLEHSTRTTTKKTKEKEKKVIANEKEKNKRNSCYHKQHIKQFFFWKDANNAWQKDTNVEEKQTKRAARISIKESVKPFSRVVLSHFRKYFLPCVITN